MEKQSGSSKGAPLLMYMEIVDVHKNSTIAAMKLSELSKLNKY